MIPGYGIYLISPSVRIYTPDDAFFGVADSEQVNGSTNKLNGSQEVYALVEEPILCIHLQIYCDVELALVAVKSLSIHHASLLH